MTIVSFREPTTIRSMDELFALAHAMEIEAVQQYARIAQLMRQQGSDAVADVFEHIMSEERGHAEAVTTWARSVSGTGPDETALRWPAPPTFEEDDLAEISSSRLITPYRALCIAVRNEERAFAFWSYVAAHAVDRTIQDAAETMALQELDHVAAFRRERRRAYHAARSGGSGTAIHSGEETAVADLELRLADLLDHLARGSRDSAHREALLALGRDSRQIAALVAGLATPRQAAASPGDAQAPAERLCDIYLEAADAAQTPDDLAQYQVLAKRAIIRLDALLRNGPELPADAAR
jgi:rubrerythrin